MTGGYEEGVLHIPCGMVRREVQGFEHMIIVLDFRSFGNVIAEFSEYVYDFLAHDGHWVTGTKGVGRSWHRQVICFACRACIRDRLRTQFLYLCGRSLLQFIQLAAKLFLHFRGIASEFLEKLGDFAFFPEEIHSGFLHIFRCLAFQVVDLSQQFFYFFFHILYLSSFFAALLSRAFFSLAAPDFKYFFHCSSLKIFWNEL